MPSLKVTLALLLVFAFFGCGDAESEKSTDSARPRPEARTKISEGPKVLFLGDSISAGLHLERPLEESFPALLQDDLVAAGLPFRLVPAGVSGDTTAGGFARLGWMLKQNPDLLVVELGANDGLRGVELGSVEKNLTAIVDGAREAGVPVLLLGMRLPPNLGRPYTEGFADIYERVGALEGVTFVPFFMKGVAGVPDLNVEDGIHPTAEGHRILADNVRPFLEPLVRQLNE